MLDGQGQHPDPAVLGDDGAHVAERGGGRGEHGLGLDEARRGRDGRSREPSKGVRLHRLEGGVPGATDRPNP